MIDNTAKIHPSAKIESNVIVGPYAVIGQDAVLKSGANVGAHAIVEFAEIGENCTIYPHACVGTPPQDIKYRGERTGLILGANSTVREFATLHRGSNASGLTKIGSDCFFMANSHVGHACVVGNGVVMANSTVLGGSVEVGDNANLSALIAVHQFARVGRLAMVSGGSMVSQDILPFCQCQGDRSKLVGLNLVGMRRKGFSRELIGEIKSAYRILFLSGITMAEAIDQLEATDPKIEISEMIEFIKPSKRGICHHGRKGDNQEL